MKFIFSLLLSAKNTESFSKFYEIHLHLKITDMAMVQSCEAIPCKFNLASPNTGLNYA